MSDKRDYLNGTGYTIAQKPGWYHFNSDTELLGRFLKVHEGERVLDIGCHQGALLYYAYEQAKIEAVGIDVFEEVLASARENAQDNQVDFKFVCSRVQDYKEEPFDVILCNPPYFSSDLANQNPYLDQARREVHLPLKVLMERVHYLLKPTGRFYLVHKAEKLPIILKEAQAQGLSLSRLAIAYVNPQSKGKSLLMELKWGLNQECRVEQAIYLNHQ